MKKSKFDAKIFEQLINTSPAAMFIVDRDRNVLFANKSYAKMFGYTVEEIVHVNVRKFHVNDESYEKFAKIAFDSVAKGVPVATDFQAKKKDGTLFWIHIVGSLVKNQDLILWTMVDITEIAPRPFFVVTGDADELIDLAGVRRLFARAGEPKTMHVVHGADHVLSDSHARRETNDLIVAWLKQNHPVLSWNH